MSTQFVLAASQIIVPCTFIYCGCKYIASPLITQTFKYLHERQTKKPF